MPKKSSSPKAAPRDIKAEIEENRAVADVRPAHADPDSEEIDIPEEALALLTADQQDEVQRDRLADAGIEEKEQNSLIKLVITTLKRNCKARKVVYNSGKNQTSADPAAQIRAATELGKVLGLGKSTSVSRGETVRVDRPSQVLIAPWARSDQPQLGKASQ